MKIKAKTLNEFAKEIHSSELHSKVKSFTALEKMTKAWVKEIYHHSKEGQFTGFYDIDNNPIHLGDYTSDIVETDKGKVKSVLQVVWDKETGMLAVDISFERDKSLLAPLYKELQDFEYRIVDM